MALVLKDRVKETSTTAGTGTLTLDGAASGFQSFAAVGNGNTTYYAIVDPITGDWEVGLGTYTSSGTTLSRTTVLSSSNSGALVNFAANQKDVFVTYPSEKSVYEDASNVVNATSFGAITATSAALTTGTVSTTPASNTDIANKQYVDGLVTQGISYHEPVYVESPNTTGNLNATYNNGASGVGATLTNAGTQVALTVDGILMTVGKRVLIYNQTNATQNGVYTVTTVGDGSTNWVLTRATDANTYGLRDPNALGYNDAFFVTNGDTGAGETYVCTTTGTITFGTTNITFAQISSAQVYTAGTGLNLSPATTFNISNTGVSASTYGSASAVPVFAVNAQGQLTSVTNTNIAINGSAVSGNISGSAGSVANALTLGSYLTGTSFNGSSAVTAAVDATTTNTASKVVARDSNGDFAAGTITATLSGAATSATTATNIAGGGANQIPYQTGAATTSFITAPTTAGTYLGWNGSAFTYSAISTPASVTFNNSGSGDASGTTFNGSTARTISYNTVGAPSTGGTGASGTWNISISGNAATATSASSSSTATYATTAGSVTGQANSATITATSANTASQIVLRDSSGNFSAGTITASLSGNATTSSSTTGNAATATLATKASTLAQSGGNGAAMTFNWSGQSGQPTWLWGSNDGTNVYVWNPSNFSVNYATSAGSATSATTATTASSCSGNSATATALTSTQSSWTANVAGNVVGLLGWKNYGNGHVIFDASAGTSPSGGAVNNTNAQIAWSGTYPTLMGWNGSNTYGVRVDSARVADSAPANGGNSSTVGGFTPSQTAGAASRVVVADGNGYILNNYFNSTDNVQSASVSYVMVKAGDNYYRSGTAAAVATFISGQSMNISGSSTSCSGNAATATNASNTSSISNATGGSYNWTAANYFTSNFNTGGGSSAPLQAYSSNGSGAVMSFHRGGYYAVNFGLDSDNVMRIGGWSASANLFQMDMSGNLTMAANVTAYSDETLKKDWAPVQEGFVAKLAKVKSGTYTRIDSGERQAGVGAQSFQPLLPETVLTDNAGKLSVAYGNAAMVSAVELAKDNVELRARIEKLEALVAKLIEG